MSDGQWQVLWAGDTDLDPRLVAELHVGRVTSVAWHVDEQRPLLAAHTREDEGYLVRVWDVRSGEPSELPCVDPLCGMAFATIDGATVLVTAQYTAGLQIWSVADRRLIKTVPLGDYPPVDLRLVELDGQLHAVTLDDRGRVHRWSLPDGGYLGRIDAHRTGALWTGRRADGRYVLLTGGEDMTMWDLADGTRLPLRVPAQVHRACSVVLATVDGRDQVTVADVFNVIFTFDPHTGVLIRPPLPTHRNRPHGLMGVWNGSRPRAELAVIGGVLAVPTAWRVHLGEGLPIAGPVAQSTLLAVRWEGRELLLTAAEYDGVVALWDLDRPVERAPGHEQRVSGVAVVGPGDTVVSVDEGGTVLAREGGQLRTAPLATAIAFPAALTAWRDGESIMAVTGAGSGPVTDRRLRSWNVTTGEPYGPPAQAHLHYAQWMSWVGETLVTFGADQTLVLWRPDDGVVLAEIKTEVRSKITGYVTGIVAGRSYAALSSYAHPLTLHALEDPTAPPIVIAQASNDVVLALAGDRIIAARFDRDRVRPRTLRAWTLAGDPAGPSVPGPADIVAAAERAWPQLYVARADGTVLLLDMDTGREVCPSMRLPRRPGPVAVTVDGDLVVGYGSDVARLRPPV